VSAVGKWIVCVRDIPGAEDAYLGPFASVERAQAIAGRLRRDIEAVGASGSLDAIVEWVRPGGEVETFRDEMLKDLARLGYSR
jgi:hypothetical protein